MLKIMEMAALLKLHDYVEDSQTLTRIRKIKHLYSVERVEADGNWHSMTYEVGRDVAFLKFLQYASAPRTQKRLQAEQPGKLTPDRAAGVLLADGSTELPDWVLAAIVMLVKGDPVVTDALRDALQC